MHEADRSRALIKVSVVEDSRAVRNGLRELLGHAPGMKCVGTHPDAEEALREIPKNKPDVVLMDINLPKMSGIECVARIKAKVPDLRILMLTAFEDDDLVFDSLRNGADGYLLKSCASAEWIAAIEQVNAGGAPMSMSVARRLVGHFQNTKAGGPGLEALTKREREVLALIAQGCLYKEVGDRLNVSLSTVRAHLHSIYKRLHVQNRTQAAVKFLGKPSSTVPARPPT